MPVYIAGKKGPVILCLHGAGHSALSFSCVAKILKEKYQIISFDFRGHGRSKMKDESNMTQANLIGEVCEVMNFLYSKGWGEFSFIILGHSMGGSIAAKFVDQVLSNPKDYKYAVNIKSIENKQRWS